jgi:hypothetical protein
LVDPGRHAAVASAGRRRVLERFSTERVVPAYESCYQAALDRPPTAT